MSSSTRPHPDPVGPGQESVWDYPRPPRVEATGAHLVVVLGGVVIAETVRGYRVLETAHPPTYYFPPDDVVPGVLAHADRVSFCEWKGRATSYTVRAGNREVPAGAWSYERPTDPFAAIAGYLAFYAGPMDVCLVDGEPARPQPGGFYGGWITSTVVGPFKGGPGTRGW